MRHVVTPNRRIGSIAARPFARSIVGGVPWLNYIIIGGGALLMLFPFVWMVVTSFKPRGEILAIPPTLLPSAPTLEHYRDVFAQFPIARIYWNTIVVATTKTVLMVYTSALLGYVFAKIAFRGRELIFVLMLLTMILPLEVFVIPLYQMMVTFNVGNTHTALIVPYIFSAYATFLLRQFMFNIPNDLIDAARIDGASEWRIFHRIVLPLSGAVLATTTAFYFMWNWNDFLWPFIVITDGDKQMLPVALSSFVLRNGTNYGLITAGATLSVVPTLLIFLLAQRYVVQGVALSGMK